MRSIAELIAESPTFAGLAPHHLELIAGCGQNTRFAAGEPVFRAGEPADRFYLIRHGSVALEIDVPEHEPITIETLQDGEVARLVVAVRALSLDVRRTCGRRHERDRLRRRLPARQVRRRPRARLPADAPLRGGDRRPPAGDADAAARRLWRPSRRLSRTGRWCPRRSGCAARRQDTADTWTLELEGDAALAFEPGQFTMLGAAGLRRGADLDQRRPRPARNARPHGARGRRGHGRDLRRRAGPRARRARAVRAPVAGRRGRGRRRRDRAGGIGLAPLRPAILRLLARRERYGRIAVLYGGRSPDQLLYPGPAAGVGRRRHRRHRRTADGAGAWASSRS